jgi:hypothetical protein
LHVKGTGYDMWVGFKWFQTGISIKTTVETVFGVYGRHVIFSLPTPLTAFQKRLCSNKISINAV